MPKGYEIRWKGDAYAQAVQRETGKAVIDAALAVVKTTKKALNKEGQNFTDGAGLNDGRTPGKRGLNYATGLNRIQGLKSIPGTGIHWGGSFEDKDTKKKGDRIYWNEAEGKWVQSSPPGTPPNKQTGELRRRISYQPEFKNGQTVARVGPQDALIYARVHELGGKCGPGYRITLPPRPYLRPSFEANRELIEKLIRLAVLRAKVSV